MYGLILAPFLVDLMVAVGVGCRANFLRSSG